MLCFCDCPKSTFSFRLDGNAKWCVEIRHNIPPHSVWNIFVSNYIRTEETFDTFTKCLKLCMDHLILHTSNKVTAGFSQRKLGFNPRWLQAWFVVNEVQLEQVPPPPPGYHSTTLIYRSPLRCEIAWIRQYIIISRSLSIRWGTLPRHSAGYSVMKILYSW
jgi:hypothetical protein